MRFKIDRHTKKKSYFCPLVFFTHGANSSFKNKHVSLSYYLTFLFFYLKFRCKNSLHKYHRLLCIYDKIITILETFWFLTIFFHCISCFSFNFANELFINVLSLLFFHFFYHLSLKPLTIVLAFLFFYFIINLHLQRNKTPHCQL